MEAILATLRRIDSEWLDRQSVEKLFGVRPRRAQQLMKRLAAVELVGKNAVVRRADLLANLEALAQGSTVTGWREARQRTAEEIARAQADSAARRMPVETAPDRLKRRLSQLPPTIRLSPGRLEVTFSSINDLWRQLGELAGAAVGDREAFREAGSPASDDYDG